MFRTSASAMASTYSSSRTTTPALMVTIEGPPPAPPRERLGRAISVLIIHPQVAATASGDLANGTPSRDGCFLFVVPHTVVGDDDKDRIKVKARIVIN
ncbi:hypothetical protein U9M48_042010 [Paspalum notatum var. saurae]|uniref:Uncharacterized protein n=1 Tax=Paspalum notatum var. saurae TaxID=547442 RepID=A0AAQ3UQ09_PASNO